MYYKEHIILRAGVYFNFCAVAHHLEETLLSDDLILGYIKVSFFLA
jgi:hypothetical protein